MNPHEKPTENSKPKPKTLALTANCFTVSVSLLFREETYVLKRKLIDVALGFDKTDERSQISFQIHLHESIFDKPL